MICMGGASVVWCSGELNQKEIHTGHLHIHTPQYIYFCKHVVTN